MSRHCVRSDPARARKILGVLLNEFDVQHRIAPLRVARVCAPSTHFRFLQHREVTSDANLAILAGDRVEGGVAISMGLSSGEALERSLA